MGTVENFAVFWTSICLGDLSSISGAQRQEAAESVDVIAISEAESATVCWRNNVMIDGGCNNATVLGERILHCLVSYRQDFLLPAFRIA